jgi:endonuclease G
MVSQFYHKISSITFYKSLTLSVRTAMNPIKSLSIVVTALSISYSQSPQEISIPAHNSSAVIVKHAGFSLEYAEKYEQAKWVSEIVTRKNLRNPIVTRSGSSFKADPDIATGSSSPKEYVRTGYDRGHLAPAADMKWSVKSMHDCFYMSNMSPQAPSFNRGIWGKLEDAVRKWAIEKDTLYVVTGGFLHDGLKTIGGHVTVPDSFYKVILDLKHHEGIGFILRNEGSQLPIESFEVPIDSVEKYSGIDFYSSLPDSLENAIESHVDKEKWITRN